MVIRSCFHNKRTKIMSFRYKVIACLCEKTSSLFLRQSDVATASLFLNCLLAANAISRGVHCYGMVVLINLR